MSCIPQFPLVGSYMAGALEGLYNHALPIHTPATLLASSTAQGQTYPQVRNTIHCFQFGWEQKTSRDNMSSNIFVSVDQLSTNNKQTQSQNVHISAAFGGRGRMGLQLSENNKRTLCLNSKSVARVRQRKQMAPPCPLHRQSVLSEPKPQLALVTTYTRPNIHLQSSSEIICKVHPHTSKI